MDLRISPIPRVLEDGHPVIASVGGTTSEQTVVEPFTDEPDVGMEFDDPPWATGVGGEPGTDTGRGTGTGVAAGSVTDFMTAPLESNSFMVPRTSYGPFADEAVAPSI